MGDENVQVQFGADTGKAESGIKTIGDRLNDLSGIASKAFEANQILEFGQKLEELGQKVIDFAEHYADMGEHINRATQILGMSAEQFQQLAFAIKLTGGDADSAVQALTRFEKNIGEAGRGAGQAAPFFKAVGVSLDDLKKGDVTAVINKVADAFHNSADGVNKTTTALEIGGRTFAQMIPLLNKGSEGFQELNEKLKATGDTMTDLQKINFQETDDNMKVMRASFEGLGLTLADSIRPAIDNIVTGFTDLIEGINDSIKVGGEWHGVLQGIVVVLDAVVEAIDVFIQGIRTIYDVTVMSITIVMEYFVMLGHIMQDVLSLKWGDIETDYKAGMGTIEKVTEQTMNNIKEHWKGLDDRMHHAAKGIGEMDGGGAGKGPPKPVIPLPGDNAKAKEAAQERLKIATDEIMTEQKLRELDLADQKNILDQEVKYNIITEEQKYKILQGFADQDYKIKVDAVNKELQLDNLKPAQKQKLYDQLLILEKQHQNAIAQIQRQAQTQEMQRYQQVFATINNSFKTMIQGVLQGTQTWKQALGNMFSNILVSFAGMLEEMAAKWIENQVMMAIFGKTESSSIIGGHAAEGAAAAYASTAAIPVVGPAMAPAAAALAFGNIMAFDALPSFDVGTDFVPHDMTANIHRGERVMTSGENETFTKAMRSLQGDSPISSNSGGGNGGGDIHLHVHAMDAAGVKKFFQNNKGEVASALKAAVRGGDKSIASIMKS